MENSGQITMEDFIKSLPIDKQHTNIIHDIANSSCALVDNTVCFRAVLPSMMSEDLMIAQLLRWLNIKDYFDKDVRVYALSASNVTERYMQSIVSQHKGLSLTALPIEFRRLFNDQ